MSILVVDSFTRADSDGLGDNWALDETNSGDWSISANRVVVTAPSSSGDGTTARSTEDDFPSYYTAHATIGGALPATGYLGVSVRMSYSGSAMSSGYMLLIKSEDQTVEIVAFNSWPTKRTLVAQTGAFTRAVRAGDVVSLKIEENFNGNPLLTGYLNGVRVAQSEDTGTAITTGKAGLALYGNSASATGYFYGFQIESITDSRPSRPTITHQSAIETLDWQIVAWASQFKPSWDPYLTRHEQSRWQLADDASFGSSNIVYDTGWVDDMLTTAFFNGYNVGDFSVVDSVASIEVYVRVKYRDSYGNDTDWGEGEFLIYQGDDDTTIKKRPRSTVAPFPDDPASCYTMQEGSVNFTVVQKHEDGSESRLPLREQVLKTFSLSFKNMTGSEINHFWNHFQLAKGKNGIFVFRHPLTQETYTVRYVEDSFSKEEFENKLFNGGSLTLAEVL